MKKYLLYFIIITGTACSINAQSTSSTCKKADILIKEFEKFHFQPVAIDEKVSAEIFDDFINNIDHRGLYLTNADVKTLSIYRNQLGAQIKNNTCTFWNAFLKLYKQKLILADTLVSQLTSKPFDFNTNDFFDYSTIDNNQPKLTNNDIELKAKWNNTLKYYTLDALMEATPEIKEPLNTDNKILLKNEPLMRNKIKIISRRRIHRILEAPQGFENYISSIFLNCIANRFDPHSTYFSPAEKEQFLEMISKDGMSYGFSTDENKNGEIEITNIIPGSNAWKSNQVNEGDVMLKVKFDNNQPIDLIFADNIELNQIFASNSNSKSLEMTLRKANGQITTVLLHKEKSEQEDNVVKSYILNGTKKIGYISLPSFYDEWSVKNPLGCGNDVAKEITKLQNEKIEGLILDLRFNGGGSLREAINLAGIFIDEGPLTVLKNKNEKPTVIKDMNRGTAYDGPLLVMVNAHSASASEFLSGVLQDYNRAVIVGNTTYGKATVQGTFPLDLSFDPKTASLNATSDLGYINITKQKFYRVTAKSHQKNGVQPDILLPDLSYLSKNTEASEKYSLPNDTVGKTIYYNALSSLPIASLNSNSVERIRNNKGFNEVIALNDSIEKIDKQTENISLNINNYKQTEKRFDIIKNRMDSLFKLPSTSYTVINNAYDKKIFNVNDFSKQMNEDALKKIQHDIYLDESYKIIIDLINSK